MNIAEHRPTLLCLNEFFWEYFLSMISIIPKEKPRTLIFLISVIRFCCKRNATFNIQYERLSEPFCIIFIISLPKNALKSLIKSNKFLFFDWIIKWKWFVGAAFHIITYPYKITLFCFSNIQMILLLYLDIYSLKIHPELSDHPN